MPKVLTKVIFSLLIFLTTFISVAPNLLTTKAADQTETWYNSSFKNWYGKVYDPDNPQEIFGERYTAAQVQWVIYGFFGFLINTVTGPENSGLIQCFLTNATDINHCADELKDLISSVPNSDHRSALPPTNNSNFLSMVFADRPLSGISYVKNRLDTLKLVPEAKAQTIGFGFSALEPIRGMWRAFRDVSYGFFVIIAVVFAFMIMFRVKLSPQTVISVQTALPKIITALILVTFSYAIAGFLIDLMYVVIGFISLIATRMLPSMLPPNLQIINGPAVWFNFLTLGQPTGFNVQGGAVLLMAIYLFAFVFAFLVLAVANVGFIIFTISAAGVALLALTPIGGILGIILLIALAVVIVVVIWQFLKTLWSLLKAFVNVLLLTILAPIQLTLGALIPNFGFGAWVKSYIAALSTFVVTGALILFSYVFLIRGVVIGLSDYLDGNLVNFFVKILYGSSSSIPIAAFNGETNGWPPLLGTGSGLMMGLLFVIASFVIFTMIPKANELIQSLIQGKAFSYGTAIGEAVLPIRKGINFELGRRATSNIEIGEQLRREPDTEEEGKKLIRRGAIQKQASDYFR